MPIRTVSIGSHPPRSLDEPPLDPKKLNRRCFRHGVGVLEDGGRYPRQGTASPSLRRVPARCALRSLPRSGRRSDRRPAGRAPATAADARRSPCDRRADRRGCRPNGSAALEFDPPAPPTMPRFRTRSSVDQFTTRLISVRLPDRSPDRIFAVPTVSYSADLDAERIPLKTR